VYSRLGDVPPYREDHAAPAAVRHLRAAVTAADAVLLATPEYNGSVPGQLKNVLDWASRPFPDNVFRAKPVAVVGASTGLFGAVWAQAELRKILRTMGADVLDEELPVGQAEQAFGEGGGLVDPALAVALGDLVHGLIGRVRAPGCPGAAAAS